MIFGGKTYDFSVQMGLRVRGDLLLPENLSIAAPSERWDERNAEADADVAGLQDIKSFCKTGSFE